MRLEIYAEPFDVPNDRDAAVRDIRAQQPNSPAETVRQGLALFNLTHPGELHAPLHVFLRDRATHEVHGGLLGRTGRGALYVEHLWVAEPVRRQRHGSALLARAEDEARRRGCRIAHVETYSFHGPAFYERNGYSVFGCLAGFSAGYTRLYLRKDLGAKHGGGAAQQATVMDSDF